VEDLICRFRRSRTDPRQRRLRGLIATIARAANGNGAVLPLFADGASAQKMSAGRSHAPKEESSISNLLRSVGNNDLLLALA